MHFRDFGNIYTIFSNITKNKTAIYALGEKGFFCFFSKMSKSGFGRFTFKTRFLRV
jgi:hypothetical protein